MGSAPAPTRRGFLGAVAAGIGAHTAAGQLVMAGAAPTPKPCTPQRPGVPTQGLAITPSGRTVWTTDSRFTKITAHRTRRLRKRRRQIDVGGAPIDIVITPNGHLALVVTAFWDRPGLAIVNLRTRKVRRVDVGPEPHSVAVAPDGRSAWVAGGGTAGTLTKVDLVKPRHAHRPIKLGADPRGIAIHPSGHYALVALNGQSSVAKVTLTGLHKHKRKVHRLKTSPYPCKVAISPDGKHAVVTHNGFKADFVTSLGLSGHHTPRRVKVGMAPAGVAYSRTGKTALVTGSKQGTVVALDAKTGKRRKTYKPGGALRGIVVSANRAFVADSLNGKLTSIRLGAFH